MAEADRVHGPRPRRRVETRSGGGVDAQSFVHYSRRPDDLRRYRPWDGYSVFFFLSGF